MTGLHLVTGYKGSAHVTAADQGLFNAMSVGAGEYVFTNGRRFDAQIISNNAVRIYDGSLMMNGRYVTLPTGSYLDAIIANGTSGMKRHDIIGVRYEMNATTGVESVSLVVGEGTPSATAPTDPANNYTSSILDGATVHDMWLYRVVLNGLTIEKVEPLFTVLAPMVDMQRSSNMLINGDFNCNQRGKSTYDTTDKVMYTVDMWRGHQIKVNVLNEGVKVTGVNADIQGYFTQFIQLGKLKTTTYTIAAMADDKLCTFTVTPSGSAKEKIFDKFKISALTTSTWSDALGDYDNKLKINICPIGTNEVTFKYIDVFEGIVAYPHVKEDPAVAMTRCRRYVQKATCFCPFLKRFSGDTGGWSYRFGIPIDNMASEPTLESCEWYFEGSETTSGNEDTLTTYYKSGREWQFDTKPETKTAVADYTYGVRIRYTLTCEPNDA